MSNPFEEATNPFDNNRGTDSKRGAVELPLKKVTMESMTKHNFQWHNYKRPTFCAHCKNLLVGLAKQGMRCKRCEIDVHDKCQEDLAKPCIELIVGQHNFRERTYKQPTYCDFCKKLLVGLVNQGLKCSECGSNVHEKCQEKIEAKCSQTMTRKKESIGFNRSKYSRSSQKGRSSSREKPATSHAESPAGYEETGTDPSALFAPMPSKKRDQATSSPMASPKSSRSSSLAEQQAGTSSGKGQSKGSVQQVNEMVSDVVEIMKTNAEKLNERGAKIENLHDNALQLEEKATLFKEQAKDLKKKMWWKNYKMIIALVVALILLIAIIVVAVVFSKKKK